MHYIDIIREKQIEGSIHTADDMSASVNIIEFLESLYYCRGMLTGRNAKVFDSMKNMFSNVTHFVGLHCRLQL